MFARVVCAAANVAAGIQKKAPRGRPFAAKKTAAENVVPHVEALCASVAGSGAAVHECVACVEAVCVPNVSL